MEQTARQDVNELPTAHRAPWAALVVDDDAGVRQSLRLCLENAGARVLGVATGGAALEHHQGQTTHARGAGIGLYMCRQIVELHGGDIVCTAGADDRGTCITVTLPLKSSVVAPASGQTATYVRQ